MKNLNLQRISNSQLSDDIKAIANSYGFKTIGKFNQFLKQCNPNTKLYFGIYHIRVSKVSKQLNAYLLW